MNFFAYGTLMIPSVLYSVISQRFRAQKSILRGYARFTVKGESYPGIIPVEDATTEGIIYFDVDELSLERLDAFEGDLYQRTTVRVEKEDKKMIDAETYVIKPGYRNCLSCKEWDVNEFIQKDLDAFLEACSGFQKNV